MTAANERTGSPRVSRSPDPARARRRHRRRHEDAVIQAEVMRLARALGAAEEPGELTRARGDGEIVPDTTP
jgi:hypothetical protein